MEAAAGHRFMCVSMARSQLSAAARTLGAARPRVYSTAAPRGGGSGVLGFLQGLGLLKGFEAAGGAGAMTDLAGQLADAAAVRGDARGVAWGADLVSLAGAGTEQILPCESVRVLVILKCR